MNKEEIKKELLEDKQLQFQVTIASTFSALYTQLIRKGILTNNDIEEINKLTDELTAEINDLTIDEILKKKIES